MGTKAEGKRITFAWKLLLAAAFLAYYVVLIYSERYQPGETGIGAEFSQSCMLIQSVSPDTPASRAGLKSGDVVRAIDGRPVRTWEDWRHFRATREIGHEYSFQVERVGEGISKKSVVLGRKHGDPLASLERKRYVQGALLVLAIFIFFMRNLGCAAFFGAWLLASIGTAPFFPEAEMTAIWRNLPSPIGLLLWGPQISHLMLLPMLFTFFATLPRPLFARTRPWIIVWSPALVSTAWAAPLLYAHVYNPPLIGELPAWVRFILGLAVMFYGGGGLVALFVNYLRLTHPQERLRFRVLVVGAFIGLAPLIPFLAAVFWGSLTLSPTVWFFVSDPYRHSLVPLFVVFPLSLVYAIARHRVLRTSARDIPTR